MEFSCEFYDFFLKSFNTEHLRSNSSEHILNLKKYILGKLGTFCFGILASTFYASFLYETFPRITKLKFTFLDAVPLDKNVITKNI